MIIEPYKRYAIDFIESLAKKDIAKCFRTIELLKVHGFDLSSEYLKHIDDKIWELRVKCSNNSYRIFYFVYLKNHVVLLNGFIKKTNKTPRNEIAKAKKLMEEYLCEKKK